MSAFNARQFSDLCAIVGTIDPDAYGTGTQTSDWVDMKDFESLAAVGLIGTVATTDFISAKLEQGTDSTGGGAKDIDSSAITNLSGTDDDKQFIIQCRTDVMDVASTFRYLRLSLTSSSTAADLGAVLFGVNPNYGPASDNDLATVAEIVTCTS